MKIGILSTFFLAIACVAGAGTDDTLIAFSTKGPDRYADGTTVLDGECYALVWSIDGNFDGFFADGRPIDADDRIVLVGAVAASGRCPDVLFQIPSEQAAKLDGGSYAVYLLDTRVASLGSVKPRGTVNGRISILNGYGEVSASITAGKATSLGAVAEKDAAGGQVASSGVLAPRGVRQPKIKSVRVDGENVVLTVENLKGFMRVHGGGDIKASTPAGPAVEVDEEEGDILLFAPKYGDSAFYRIIRN